MTQDSSRHPVEVEGIGLMQQQKHKAYMFSVMWSDQQNVLIYRTFEEFKNFQKELKRKFPLEAGALKKSERTIPKLKDAPRTITKRKGNRRFLERLRLLETYSQTLLALDAKISQCQFVIQFFTLRIQDLNPSFPENSLVIMLPEKKDKRCITPSPIPDVSGPLFSARYLCTEDFQTIDLRNQPFSVKRHQLLDVLMKENTGWWLVENGDMQLAWFPAPYLKATEERCTAQDCPAEGTACIVVNTFEAQNSDELSVSVGLVVKVLKQSDNGWWLISSNSRTGYIPSIYLRPYSNPYQKLENILSRDGYVSTPNLRKETRNREVYAFPHPRSALYNQRKAGSGNPGERDRSHSLGGVSVRSDMDSDLDSVTGSFGKLNSGSDDNFSVRSSLCVSAVELASCVPKIPARPNPREIIQKCSTVTRRAVQRSLVRPSVLEGVKD
ncbi:NADPH oxidase organizer 1-like [Ascaphus truei]|uniref:NADPH oxidase organizer 1-like n=1 Tax=Ascaphus truei TaxID=8439 RepID=UPI003F5AB3C6